MGTEVARTRRRPASHEEASGVSGEAQARLPAERELAKEFGVAYLTLRHAMQLLRESRSDPSPGRVKGGKTVQPQFARDLLGTVTGQKAQMGILILMTNPTPGILEVVNHVGTYVWQVNGQAFPKLQVLTIKKLLAGKRPSTPPMLPYTQAPLAERPSTQATFDEVEELDDGEAGGDL